MRWSNPKAGHRSTCFYCNEFVTLSEVRQRPGGFIEWTCRSCDAINILDNVGDITDPSPGDVAAAQSGHYRFASSFAPSRSNFDEVSPFCHNCQNNHRIVMDTLANFESPSNKDYDLRIARYKAELEKRYPPVCANCASNVSQRLEQNNYEARVKLLGSFLSNTRSYPVVATSKAQRRHTPELVLKPRWTIWKVVKLLAWAARGGCAILHSLGFITILLANTLYSDIQLSQFANYDKRQQQTLIEIMLSLCRQLSATVHSTIAQSGSLPTQASESAMLIFALLRCMAPFSVLYYYWNYGGGAAILSGTRIVGGRGRYFFVRMLLFSEYIGMMIALPRLFDLGLTVKGFQFVNMIVLVFTVIFEAYSYTYLEFESVSPASPRIHTQREPTTSTDHMVESLSAMSPATTSSSKLMSFQTLTEQPRQRVLSRPSNDDEMDWRPSFAPTMPDIMAQRHGMPDLPGIPKLADGQRLAPPPNGAISSRFSASVSANGSADRNPRKEQYFQANAGNISSLRAEFLDNKMLPQTFFPKEEPTGLEDIFAPALRISDIPSTAEQPTEERKILNSSATGWLIAFSIVVGILAVGIYMVRHALDDFTWFTTLPNTYLHH
ncbi:Ima1 N-terminal domain-containing protein [Limtongia smithiae]|uniref:Ima1 N-terminal domain-containing protein n=1 Tax=Limtongia smithiae TaxID=1125753 RepID=UPI0034CD2B7B